MFHFVRYNGVVRTHRDKVDQKSKAMQSTKYTLYLLASWKTIQK